ncbi:hypothetical protein D3C79_1065000 [compost metagenome]
MITYAILLAGAIYLIAKWFVFRKRKAGAATASGIDSGLIAALNRTGETNER